MSIKSELSCTSLPPSSECDANSLEDKEGEVERWAVISAGVWQGHDPEDFCVIEEAVVRVVGDLLEGVKLPCEAGEV